MVRSYLTLFEQLSLKLVNESRRSIVVTGPSRREGRTTVAVNLALAAARLGACRTLLVDADIERPGLSRLYGRHRSRGLCDILAGQDDWRNVLHPVDGSLALLSAGTGGTTAVVAAQPGRLAGVMDEWKKEFDWIVVDTPPILLSASALAFGRQATGAMVVARSEHTRGEVLEQGVARLRDQGIQVLGVVLNRRRFFIPRFLYRRI